MVRRHRGWVIARFQAGKRRILIRQLLVDGFAVKMRRNCMNKGSAAAYRPLSRENGQDTTARMHGLDQPRVLPLGSFRHWHFSLASLPAPGTTHTLTRKPPLPMSPPFQRARQSLPRARHPSTHIRCFFDLLNELEWIGARTVLFMLPLHRSRSGRADPFLYIRPERAAPRTVPDSAHRGRMGPTPHPAFVKYSLALFASMTEIRETLSSYITFAAPRRTMRWHRRSNGPLRRLARRLHSQGEFHARPPSANQRTTLPADATAPAHTAASARQRRSAFQQSIQATGAATLATQHSHAHREPWTRAPDAE
jgi:hypothetical protein